MIGTTQTAAKAIPTAVEIERCWKLLLLNVLVIGLDWSQSVSDGCPCAGDNGGRDEDDGCKA
jgi:hypothetical protein